MSLRIPRAPNKTEIWWFSFVDRNHPKEFQDMAISAQNHVFGPAGLPPKVTETLHTAMAKVLSDDSIKQKLQAQGITPLGWGPAELRKFVNGESEKWGKLIRERGLKGA